MKPTKALLCLAISTAFALLGVTIVSAATAAAVEEEDDDAFICPIVMLRGSLTDFCDNSTEFEEDPQGRIWLIQ
jgi:hypothetical protein